MSERLAIEVHVVDDDAPLREALGYLLEGFGLPVRCHASGEAFLDAARLDAPGVVLLDVRMPGLGGEEVHDRLVAADSSLAVIFLTSHGDLPMALRAFRQGACDFHEKPARAATLLPAIEQAQQRSLAAYRQRHYRQQFAALTPRERQLFEQVVDGRINREIAESLGIAVRTVEVHRARMMERLGATSIADLIRIDQALRG